MAELLYSFIGGYQENNGINPLSQKLFGKPPEIKAIHAGLECGIIGEKYPGIDMISFGPTLESVHSPDERIYVDTVGRFWDFLLAILANIG